MPGSTPGKFLGRGAGVIWRRAFPVSVANGPAAPARDCRRQREQTVMATDPNRARVWMGRVRSGGHRCGWRQLVLATLLALASPLPLGIGIDIESATAQGNCQTPFLVFTD